MLVSFQEAAKAKGGSEEEEEDEVRQVEKEVTPNPVDSASSSGRFVRNVERGSGGDGGEESFQYVNQSWDCSQVENELEERDAMDWLMDDEMVKQCEEVAKEGRTCHGEEK